MAVPPKGETANDKIAHLYLALRSIRDVDRLLIKDAERPQLLQAICDTLIKNRSYYNAWIVVLDESNRVLETAEAGLGADFQVMRDRLRRGVFTDCGREALARSQVVVVNRPYDTCADCPLSEKYSGRSAMTVRLENAGRILGLLCVSIPRHCTENEEELELLQEIAGDIAFGLTKISLEAALKENEQSFQDLVENSPTGILIVQEGIVIYRNPEQDRISGAHHRVGMLFEFANIHPDDREKVEKLYEQVSSGAARTVDTDFRFYREGRMGSRVDMRWVYFRASAIEIKGREAVLMNMIDITRVKETEQLVITKDKMASLGHIAAGIAHEIRNPLSGVNIYLNTLENLLGESDQPEMTGKILKQIQSASRKIELIIKRVIDFSKPSDPKFVSMNINQPIEEALELSSVSMRKNGIQIEMVLADDLPECRIDQMLIEEVILNLITNAAESMKQNKGDKRIAVASSSEDGHICVRIADSGPGIPPELRTKILEPFYTTKKGGTGIGLTLCHRIVVDHGGTLTINTSKWSGAEFIIKIPIERRN